MSLVQYAPFASRGGPSQGYSQNSTWPGSYPANKLMRPTRYGGTLAASKGFRKRYPLYNKMKTMKWYRDSRSSVPPKFIDNTYATLLATFNPAFYLINGLQQGTSPATRIGNKIKMTSIQLRAQFFQNTSGNPCTIRYMIVHDRQTNGSVPAAADLLLGTATQLVTLGPLNLANATRFSVLKDVTQELDNGHGINFFTQYYHKSNLDTSYGTLSNAGTVADITEGALYFVFMADQSNAMDPPLLNFYTRVRFIDQ